MTEPMPDQPDPYCQWALFYQSLGWSVVPVRPGEKMPAVQWAAYQAAPASREQIEGWWEGPFRGYGVGLIQGAAAGTLVIDIDDHELEGRNGSEALSELERRHGPLPETAEAITGSGGRHLFFRHPGGDTRIRTAKDVAGKGIDVRGDGGFVVAPPSLHASGRHYAWEVDHHPPDVMPAVAPGWLIDIVRDPAPGAAPRQPGPSDGTVTDATPTVLRTKIRSASDESVRKSCWEATRKVGPFLLSNGFPKIIAERNRFARTLGFVDFYDMKVTQEIGRAHV